MKPTLLKIFEATRKASCKLNLLTDEQINTILLSVAEEALKNIDFILRENQKDLKRMNPDDQKYDRLMLTKERIEAIADDMRNVASLASPLGLLLDEMSRPNGLKIKKITVPFGVIGIIYEARPNVSFDVFSLCLKSGNACVLKGGSDAESSNRAIVKIIHDVLRKSGLDEHIVTLLPSDRESAFELLKAQKYVDLIIPRGSSDLIQFVRRNTKIPIIETGAGICHTYFDEFGDKEIGAAIILNAKTRRVSVCNALDCLVIHEKRLSDLPFLCAKLATKNVCIFADTKAFTFLSGKYPAHLLEKATEDSFGTEFLDYKMAIKTVSAIHEAIEHITCYSSKHSEAIISKNEQNIFLFDKMIDAACVYTNSSTAFTDGSQFGLGAEIGISTQKLHARGPMALRELTSYKWIVKGDGQVRS